MDNLRERVERIEKLLDNVSIDKLTKEARSGVNKIISNELEIIYQQGVIDGIKMIKEAK